MRQNARLLVFLCVIAAAFSFGAVRVVVQDIRSMAEAGFFVPGRESRERNAALLQAALAEARPTRRPGADDPEMSARAAIALFVGDGKERTLFSLRDRTPYPIASLTKLMTALVSLERIPGSAPVPILADAVAEDGDMGQLREGELWTSRDLLYPLLIESSNDAAAALADVPGRSIFAEWMNEEAREIGLSETRLVNPTGLDEVEGGVNLSSARDIAHLADHIYRTRPELFNILSLSSFDLVMPDGRFHHRLQNTNRLLESTDWPTEILGGKTGWTPRAKGNLLIVMKAPKDRGRIIFAVIGSDDRFGDMRRMVEWGYAAYRW